jgi:hypothetical protein
MEIGSVVKLQNGYRGVIIGTPKTFMSGGSYEIEYTNENGEVKRKWVKPEEILYTIDEKTEDDINNYFEIMFDEDGVHLIPKNLKEITVFDENEELKSIEFDLEEGVEKHNKISIHIGNTDIWSECNKKPEPPEEPEKYTLI